MHELNRTSMILGLLWIVGSYAALRTVFEDWLITASTGLIPIIILGPVLLIKVLFDYILKYDFFNKDYKKNNRKK